MAQDLSWHTVAKHSNNIYHRLRVTGRRDAVRRVEALGILALGLREVPGA